MGRTRRPSLKGEDAIGPDPPTRHEPALVSATCLRIFDAAASYGVFLLGVGRVLACGNRWVVCVSCSLSRTGSTFESSRESQSRVRLPLSAWRTGESTREAALDAPDACILGYAGTVTPHLTFTKTNNTTPALSRNTSRWRARPIHSLLQWCSKTFGNRIDAPN